MFYLLYSDSFLRKSSRYSLNIKMADTGNEDRVQKMEVDYSSTVEEKLPKCEKIAKVSLILLLFAIRMSELNLLNAFGT